MHVLYVLYVLYVLKVRKCQRNAMNDERIEEYVCLLIENTVTTLFARLVLDTADWLSSNGTMHKVKTIIKYCKICST